MDVRPVLTNFYRYNFRDLLLKNQAEQTEQRPPARQQPLFANVITTRRSATYARPMPQPPAPQGVGEMKHAATEGGKTETPFTKDPALQQSDPKDDSWSLDTKVRQEVDTTYFKPPLSVRQRMEDRVRKCKKAGLPCPYADRNFNCSALFIRCGDRIQYGLPESVEQKNMPHTCLYRPKKSGAHIIIADRNKAIRDFCKNAIEVFYNYDEEKVATAGSAQEALDLLNSFKLEGKRCGLFICDTTLLGSAGFDVVTELFERNVNTDVILLKKEQEEFHKPQGFKGWEEIVPNKRLVKKVISKPFHSQDFIASLKEMDISQLLQS